MASVAVTNTFSAGTTIASSAVNTNFTDLVNYVNNRNSGSSTWDAVSALSSSGVPLTVDNSTGTSSIAIFKDNGTAVSTWADGGTLTHDGAMVINEAGADKDVRIEGDTDAALFFTDASTDNAGIGTQSPGTKLEILKTSAGAATTALMLRNSSGTADTETVFELNPSVSDTGIRSAQITGKNNGSGVISMFFKVSNAAAPAEAMSIAGNGTVVINESGSADADTRIESDTNANMFFLDSSANALYLGGTSAAAGTVTYTSGGGLQIGNATGGDKGSGTINTAADIYRNNAVYNHPDYVFEKWATGKIEMFKDNPGASDYDGILSIESLASYCKKNFELPRVKTNQVVGGGQGLFARTDIALEKIEEAYLYIFQLHERLDGLEKRIDFAS